MARGVVMLRLKKKVFILHTMTVCAKKLDYHSLSSSPLFLFLLKSKLQMSKRIIIQMEQRVEANNQKVVGWQLKDLKSTWQRQVLGPGPYTWWWGRVTSLFHRRIKDQRPWRIDIFCRMAKLFLLCSCTKQSKVWKILFKLRAFLCVYIRVWLCVSI